MACFVAPAMEAVITTTITKVLEKKERTENRDGEHHALTLHSKHSKYTSRLSWLNTMLWGGTALLALEHAWHGELMPTFPFFTAALNAKDRIAMFHEIATTGVCMALLVTLTWAVMVNVSEKAARRAGEQAQSSKEEEA